MSLNAKAINRYRPVQIKPAIPIYRVDGVMISKLITLLIILFFIIVVVGVVLKLVRLGITLAVIVGITALILHFMKKNS
jgi:hypothetical protein